MSGVVGLSEVIFFWADVYFGVQKSGTQKLREVGLDYGASACFVCFLEWLHIGFAHVVSISFFSLILRMTRLT